MRDIDSYIRRRAQELVKSLAEDYDRDEADRTLLDLRLSAQASETHELGDVMNHVATLMKRIAILEMALSEVCQGLSLESPHLTTGDVMEDVLSRATAEWGRQNETD